MTILKNYRISYFDASITYRYVDITDYYAWAFPELVDGYILTEPLIKMIRESFIVMEDSRKRFMAYLQ